MDGRVQIRPEHRILTDIPVASQIGFDSFCFAHALQTLVIVRIVAQLNKIVGVQGWYKLPQHAAVIIRREPRVVHVLGYVDKILLQVAMSWATWIGPVHDLRQP